MIARSKLYEIPRISAMVSYPSGWDGGTKRCLPFGVIVVQVYSVSIHDITNKIQSCAAFAVHIILHLLSTFTTDIIKGSAAKVLDSHFCGSPQHRLAGTLSLELDGCQLDIYRERCQLRWGTWYEFWLSGQNVLCGIWRKCRLFWLAYFYSQLISSLNNRITSYDAAAKTICLSVCVSGYMFACM